MSACRISGNHNVFRRHAAAFPPASPSPPGHRRPQWGSGGAARAGNRCRTPASRSATTARRSAAGASLANTPRSHCRARSRSLPRRSTSELAREESRRESVERCWSIARGRCRRSRSVHPFAHDAAAVGQHGVDGWTRVPASEGPNVPMILAMIWRESHTPHARSGGISPVIGRSVYAQTAAAPRDRSDPRAGTPSVHGTQSIPNGDISQWQILRVRGLGMFRGAVLLRT